MTKQHEGPESPVHKLKNFLRKYRKVSATKSFLLPVRRAKSSSRQQH